MTEYHKINSVYYRDTKGKFILGQYSCPEFEYLKDLPWDWTEKVDGTNIRIQYFPDDYARLKLGGRTDNAQLPNKLVSYIQQQPKLNVETFREIFGTSTNVILYGEGYGAGIQKGGGNYSPDQKFILFDVKIDNW